MDRKGHGDFSGLLYALLGFAVLVITVIIAFTWGVGKLIVKWTGRELRTFETVLLCVMAVSLMLAALKFFGG